MGHRRHIQKEAKRSTPHVGGTHQQKGHPRLENAGRLTQNPRVEKQKKAHRWTDVGHKRTQKGGRQWKGNGKGGDQLRQFGPCGSYRGEANWGKLDWAKRNEEKQNSHE